MAKTHTVTAERGTSDVWVLECAELGTVLQAKRLAHAADEMREAMAYQAGVSPGELHIMLEVIFPSTIAELKTRADTQREEAARLTAEAKESTP